MRNWERKSFNGLRNRINRVTLGRVSYNSNFEDQSDAVGNIESHSVIDREVNVPPSIRFFGKAYTYREGTVLNFRIVDQNGARNVTYSISAGALPDGLTLASNGVISGTIGDQAVEDGPIYTVTILASNVYGNDSRTISFTIVEVDSDAPVDAPIISYDEDVHLLVIGSVITPIDPTITGDADTFRVDTGTLPQGLTLNSLTGRISGNPQTPTGGEVQIGIIANGPGGDSDPVFITFNIGYAPTLDYTGSPYSLVVGDAVSYLPDTGGAAEPVTFSVFSGVLPSGLVLNTSTGRVSGTIDSLEYINSPFSGLILATNIFGSGTFTTVWNISEAAGPSPLLTDLYAYFTFDEVGDLVARVDSVSGYSTNPGIGTTANTSGKFDGCVEGGGLGTSIEWPSASGCDFEPSQKLYVAYWVKQKESAGGDGRGHFSIRKDGGAFFAVRQPDGDPRKRIEIETVNMATGPTNFSLMTTAEVSAYPDWSLVEVFYDPDASGIGVAIDGGAWESGNFTIAHSPGSAYSIYFGYAQLGGGGYWQNYLDEFYYRIGSIPDSDDRALLWNAGAGISYPFSASPPYDFSYSLDYASEPLSGIFPPIIASVSGSVDGFYLYAGSLPSGITLNAVNGTISGIATQAGDFSPTIAASGAGGIDTVSVYIEIYTPWNAGDPGEGEGF